MEMQGLGVRELAREVPCNPGFLSNLRSGRRRPSEGTARRVDDLLKAGGSLAVLAMRAAPERVGARPERAGRTESADQAMRARLGTFSAVQVDELVSHLNDQWHVMVKADNLLGPRHALGTVNDNLGVIDALLRVAREPIRNAVLGLGAMYAESAAWLHEDSGDTTEARYWTRRSTEWAIEANNRQMISWALFRRSQQVAVGGEAAQVAGLAVAARREGADLPRPMRAAILQQEAHAYAMDGDEASCHRALDGALDLATAADDPGDASAGHGSFCTAAYLEVQRGVCWLRLGKPARAIPVLGAAVEALPPAYRRDRGVALSYQAAAFAAEHEPSAAADAALQALEIARGSGSGRILEMIVQAADRLVSHSENEAVIRLRSALAATQVV
jgi:hypothetical protein